MALVGEIRSKDEIALLLARARYVAEQGVSKIYRLLAKRQVEMRPDEPIKLLEVNRNTIPTGVEPVYFGPAGEIIYPSVVVEVTPQEFEEISQGSRALPHGWQIGPQIRRR